MKMEGERKKKKGGLSCKRVSTTQNDEQLLRCSFWRKKNGETQESERRITKVLKREERRTPRYAFFRFSYRKHVMIWTHVYTKINKPFLFVFFSQPKKIYRTGCLTSIVNSSFGWLVISSFFTPHFLEMMKHEGRRLKPLDF